MSSDEGQGRDRRAVEQAQRDALDTVLPIAANAVPNQSTRLDLQCM